MVISWDGLSGPRRGRPRFSHVKIVRFIGSFLTQQVRSGNGYLNVHYTYIIESLSSGHWYYGSTADPKERLDYHNKGWNRSTRSRGPWKFIFLRKFETENEARQFEFQLKRLRNKEFIKKKFKNDFIPL